MQTTKKTSIKINPFMEILNGTDSKRNKWLKELDIEQLSDLLNIFSHRIQTTYKEQLASYEDLKKSLSDAATLLIDKGLNQKEVTKLVTIAVSSLAKENKTIKPETNVTTLKSSKTK